MSGVAVVEGRRNRATQLFLTVTLAASLALQRFAIPAGDAGVDIVGPVGVLLAAIALARGALVLDRRRLGFFLLLMLWSIVGSLARALYRDPFNVPLSITSLGQFLLLNAFCVLSFSEPLDERKFFQTFTALLGVVAAGGILQFFLQFVGISFFQFTGLLPAAVLFEAGYNLVIPVGIAALNKSNGLVLLEPSFFSQMMALALIIEIVVFRRLFYLLLFGLGLVVAFSGTGLLVFGGFLVIASAGMGVRGFQLAVVTLVVCVVLAAVATQVSPDFVHVFSNRMDEVNQPGSSGFIRFQAPFMTLQSAWSRDPTGWLFGIGAGATRHLNVAFDLSSNTPTKVVLEYGVPALFLYVMMILTAARSHTQRILTLPCMILLFFCGSYEQQGAILFPIYLLICVAKLRPASANASAPPSRSASA